MKKILRCICLVLVFTFVLSTYYSVAAIESQYDKINKMVSIAENEVGYIETTYDDGSFYSKYGDWFGVPNGAWCAMFISWCADKAEISNSIIPKFSSCSEGQKWFQNKGLWKTKDQYTPQPGDIIFLKECKHVGIVKSVDDSIIHTIEGNAADSNGKNFGVRERCYEILSDTITGYGIPNKTAWDTSNGIANQKAPAYMLPNDNSDTVWEIWKNDELEVICQDGDYYLVMYPFLSTGKYVCAFVKKNTVDLSVNVPNAEEFYLNSNGMTTSQVNLYHNDSDSSLMSGTGVDKKIRGVIPSGSSVKVLFKRNNYYFVKYGNITGFAKCGEINISEQPTLQSVKICFGDVDNDGKVSIADVTVIQKYLAQMLKLTANQIKAADVNADKNVTISDATTIQKFLVKAILKLPADEITSENPSEMIPVDVTAINVVNSGDIILGETKKINYNVLPENASDKTVFWVSSDDNIVSVDDSGVMTANKTGTAQITGISKNNIRTNFTVTVRKRNIEPSSIEISNKNPAVMNNGDKLQLSAVISPLDTTDKSITWTSSNSDVASVDQNGLVTANNAGIASITAKTVNSAIYSSATIRVNRTTTYIENGTYCLKLKNTNSYLDHQGGVTNGTNVHLWDGDGNSNPNQKISLERIDDNRYLLRSSSSTDLLIDVNRGSSYSDPISVGKNVDLWKNNDWEAQEWLFTKTYDGYYIIRLNMFQGGAIEASGKDNGSNIFYGAYNCENDMQKWELVKSNPHPIIETPYWVYNTGSVGNVHVRSGPGSNYSSIGGFNEGQQISVIGGPYNNEWYKVRGANRHDGSIIEGYTHKDYLTPVQPTPEENTIEQKFNELRTRYINGQYWNKYNDYYGNKTGTIPCKCASSCTYNCSCKCGAFIYNGAEIAWQCHGYALKLGYELYGSNPNNWSVSYTLNDVRPGDIIRYLNNGHTVMVTAVSGNTVTFTDCNWSGPCKVRWDATLNKSDFTGLTKVLKHP